MGGPTPGGEAVRDKIFKEATVLLSRGTVTSVTLVSCFLALSLTEEAPFRECMQSCLSRGHRALQPEARAVSGRK